MSRTRLSVSVLLLLLIGLGVGLAVRRTPSAAPEGPSTASAAPAEAASGAPDRGSAGSASASDRRSAGSAPDAVPAEPDAAAPAARGTVAAALGDEETAVKVEATLQNLEGNKARFDIRGRVGYLPDGAVLHVSLRVRDLVPVIEAAFFQVDVKGGNFSGFKEWDEGTLAPIGYQTVVSISMQSQNPNVRRYLSKELGYVSDTSATIGTDDDDIGTVDERATFAIETLKRLDVFERRVEALQTELAPRLETPADAAFAEFQAKYGQSLKQTLEDIEGMRAQYIAWFEGHNLTLLEQTIRVLSRALKNHSRGRDGKADHVMVVNDLIRLRSDIDARLPTQPGQTPPGNTEKPR